MKQLQMKTLLPREKYFKSRPQAVISKATYRFSEYVSKISCAHLCESENSIAICFLTTGNF